MQLKVWPMLAHAHTFSLIPWQLRDTIQYVLVYTSRSLAALLAWLATDCLYIVRSCIPLWYVVTHDINMITSTTAVELHVFGRL